MTDVIGIVHQREILAISGLSLRAEHLVSLRLPDP
jgi:hypothetical protein